MSLSGSAETERAVVTEGIAAGGAQVDFAQLQATEGRTIVGVVYMDNSTADAGGELSFSSQRTINAETQDNTKAATVFTSYGGGQLWGLDIRWDAGEELHVHAVNNSGSTVQATFIVYYREQ